MVWRTIGWSVDAYEKGKRIFYIDILVIFDIIAFVISLLLKNRLLLIFTISLFLVLMLIQFILQRKKSIKNI